LKQEVGNQSVEALAQLHDLQDLVAATVRAMDTA
jgi:hypothetical protein